MSSFSTAEDRPVALRKRPDLFVQQSVYQKQLCWVVKDPVSLKYYRLLEPEYVILNMLDGDTSYRAIKRQLDRQFPEFSTRYEDLQQLVSSLHRSGLVIGDVPGQALPLVKRARKEKRQKFLKLFTSILAIRLPGIDPERFLQWGYPYVKWFFSRWCFTICMVLVVSAALLVLQNLDEFYRRLPEFQSFFSAQNFLLMGAVLMVTKILHEFGHGFSCKHFGGECHEIGFMLLVLTPAMYCNTSDSWVLPNKWHRAAIGAAGMYVEVVLASICTFIWWNTQPGFINYFCLNVMFVSSVSTIIFNANPLLRYDGYYILADILEIPNLSQKSQMSLLSKLRTLCLGMDPIRSRLLPQTNQWMFALYSVASFTYRWFVLFMILYFLSQVFEPYGLAVLGHTMIAISLIGLVGMPIFKLVKFFWYPGRFRQVKRGRFLVSCVCVFLIIGLICMYPLPHHVPATVVIEPLDAKAVYVTMPETLKAMNFKAGDTVKRGAIIAELDDGSMRFELERINGEIADLISEIRTYKTQDQLSLTSGRNIRRAEGELRELMARKPLIEQKRNQLTLRAPISGTVIPPPWKPAQPMPEKYLARWVGTPLEKRNIGAMLEDQTLVCFVGDPNRMKATLVIDQSDISLVKPEQTVRMMLEEYPGYTIEGTIQEVAQIDLRNVPPELSQTNGGPVATRPDASGSEKTLFVSYLASVPLVDEKEKVLPGFRGQAKIRVGESNLGSWIMRQLWKTVYFR